MGKVIRRTQSFDGQLTVGQVVPILTPNSTNGLTTDGQSSTRYWTTLSDEEMIKSLNAAQREKARKQLAQRKRDIPRLIKRLEEYRSRGKPGAKAKMTDEQAIYCRQQIKVRSLKSLSEELNFSQAVIERCVKGLTFKHLNDKEKPQW